MKIKFFILILVLISTNVFAQKKSHWAETTQLDSFIHISGNKRLFIRSNRIDKTQFEFDVKTIDKDSVQVYCFDCGQNQISLEIIRRSDLFRTDTMLVSDGQKIAIKDIFEKIGGGTSWHEKIKGDLKEIWKQIMGKRTNKFVTAAMRNSTSSPNKEEPKLKFSQSNYTHFIDLEDLVIKFQVDLVFPIKSMSIFEETGEGKLMFFSGNPEFLGDHYDVSDKNLPLPIDVLKEVSRDETTFYVISWTTIETYLFFPLERGKIYNLVVELKGDNSGQNPYAFPFQFLGEKQLEELKLLFDRD